MDDNELVNQTFIKQTTMELLKQQIEVIAAQQGWLKNQRKTINLEGERNMDPRKAAYTHLVNRGKLRQLYMVYGILCGKLPEEVESNPKIPLDMKHINEVVEQYKTQLNDEKV